MTSCVQLPFTVAAPVVLLHFACAAATTPHVCAASAFAAASHRACTATAWSLQVHSRVPSAPGACYWLACLLCNFPVHQLWPCTAQHIHMQNQRDQMK